MKIHLVSKYLSRCRLFGRSKKDDIIKENEKTQIEIIEETQKQQIDVSNEKFQEEKPLAEYTETLYSGTKKTKKTKTKPLTDQRIWRDVDLIEEKIDNLHNTQEKKSTFEIEKRVDHIVSGIEIKKPKTRKKVSNIVYVLSKPQPGELKGDWAVERNGEIYSHHKTKDNAIKQARKLAKKKKNGIIKIQNVDGSFDKPFKPKKRK